VILDQGSVDTVVLVGHSPGLPQLVAELGRPSAMRSEALEKFPTSAIAVLSTELPWTEALSGVGTFDVSSFAIPRG
jgi:phosphohistidine phosphatase SixA